MDENTTARPGGFLQTFTGKRFFPLDPRPEELDERDIAHALSLLCRFGGHSRELYCVADHSLRVSRAVPREDALWGLLHDAPEAYLIDLPRPVKRLPELARYRELEAGVMRAVCARFGLREEEPESVKEADGRMLFTERRDLLEAPPEPWEGELTPYPERVLPLSPAEAEWQFLRRFRELTATAPAADEGRCATCGIRLSPGEKGRCEPHAYILSSRRGGGEVP